MPPQPVVYVLPPPRRTGRAPVVALVVLAVLVALLGGFVVARQLQAPAEIALQPVATAGDDPFMPSVGVDAVGIRPVASTGGRYSAGTPGLYGGSGDDAVCDRTQLSRFLGEHPDKAAGWSAVLGLAGSSSAAISSYVAGLTPVVLRADTFVTNHGWSAGSVTSYPAVLQAGTAVLVDGRGNPVTRCFCGNPLSAPMSFGSVSYVGPRWVSFASTSVTLIQQSTTTTNHYTIVDVHTGRGHDRPTGTNGEQDTDTVLTDDPLTRAGSAPDLSTVDEGTSSGVPGLPDTSGGESARGTDPTLGTDATTDATAPSEDASAPAGEAPPELAGTWTPGSRCSVVTGTVTFTDATSYAVSGSPAGTYTQSGSELTLTPSAGSGSVTFRADTSPPTSFTSTATGSCVLSRSSS